MQTHSKQTINVSWDSFFWVKTNMNSQHYAFTYPPNLPTCLPTYLVFQVEYNNLNSNHPVFSLVNSLWLRRVYFSSDYIFCRGDRYVLAYICAKNLNLIIWHLLHMCYPNKNRFILIFSLLTYCANLCLQFRVIIFRQIFDSALP